jgi:hypothetical protein
VVGARINGLPMALLTTQLKFATCFNAALLNTHYNSTLSCLISLSCNIFCPVNHASYLYLESQNNGRNHSPKETHARTGPFQDPTLFHLRLFSLLFFCKHPQCFTRLINKLRFYIIGFESIRADSN